MCIHSLQSVWKAVRLTQVCIIFARDMYNCNYFGNNSHLGVAVSRRWSAQWRTSSARTVSIPVDLWGHARDVMPYSLVDSCQCSGWSCHISHQGRINISFILLPRRWGQHVLSWCLHLSLGLQDTTFWSVASCLTWHVARQRVRKCCYMDLIVTLL